MHKIFNNKKILIAGGSGLVGTNLTEYLVKEKVNITSSFFSKIKNKKLKKYYKKFNFLNIKDCLKSTKNKDIVIICAVQGGGIKLLKKATSSSIIPNILIRANLLEACKINKVKKVIWISSSTVYQPANYPIKEIDIDLNKNPYPIYRNVGWSYRYLENLFSFYQRTTNLDIKIIRTTSIYGPYDNFDEKKSHVVPALIKKALKKNKRFSVLGDKKVIRDFVYVEDLVLAIIKLIKSNKKIKPINFSYGREMSIEKLSKLILLLCHRKSKIIFNNKSLSSAKYRVLNNYLFDRTFGKIKRTSIKDGLKKTINWYLNYSN